MPLCECGLFVNDRLYPIHYAICSKNPANVPAEGKPDDAGDSVKQSPLANDPASDGSATLNQNQDLTNSAEPVPDSEPEPEPLPDPNPAKEEPAQAFPAEGKKNSKRNGK